jgi:hypothetical protein
MSLSKDDNTQQMDLLDDSKEETSTSNNTVVSSVETRWFIAFFIGVSLAATFAVFRPFDGQSLSLGERVLLSFDALGVGFAVFYMAGLTYGRWKEHKD